MSPFLALHKRIANAEKTMSVSKLIREGHTGFARIACLIGGAVWGLYWIPLRSLDAAGISGIWATALIHLIPLVLIVPLALPRRSQWQSGGWALQASGASMGLAILLYSTAFLYTDVVHAILLYYLTPIWGALFGRVWLKERITGDRYFAIALGLLGMMIILNIDQGFPWPRNIGDWMALSSGVIWALAATLTRRFPQQNAFDIVSAWFVWSCAIALLGGFIFQGPHSLPSVPTIAAELIWLVPITLLVVLPIYLAITWGLPQLNPGTSGLLFMTEISVGAIAAAVLTDEPFGFREWAGVILISLAGLAEVLLPRVRLFFKMR